MSKTRGNIEEIASKMIQYEDWLLVDASEVETGLYLSNIEAVTNKPFMERLGVTHILSLDLVPLPQEVRPHTLKGYMWIKAQDSEGEDLISKFSQSYQFISEAQRSGGRTIVHCIAGISRSATTVIAYLMRKYHWGAEKAHKYVESRRDIIYPNPGFLSQLRLFESMRWTIDPTNLIYRRLILNWLRTKFKAYEWKNGRNETPPKDLIDEYMVKLRSLDGSTVAYFSQANYHQQQSNDSNMTMSATNGTAPPLPQDLIPVIKPELTAIFKCKNCRLFLFRDLNVIANPNVATASPQQLVSNNKKKNNIEPSEVGVPYQPSHIFPINSEEPCNNIYIEPQDWMMAAITELDAGNLSCKNCRVKLGAWNWRGFWCGCPVHDQLTTLMIKIDAKKVDRHACIPLPSP